MQLSKESVRLRNMSNSTIDQESRSTKSKGSILDDQIDTSSDEFGVSRSSRNIVGVRKRNSGKYGVKIYDRIRKKYTWLGTFDSAEEASKVYWTKKKELEKEFQVLDKEFVGIAKRTSRFVGVSVIHNDGKFAAHIRDPIRKKKLHLGYFSSEEEAAEVYLAKKAELEKEVKGMKGIRWMSIRKCRTPRRPIYVRTRKNTDELGQCREENSIDSDKQESANMEIDHYDTSNNQSGTCNADMRGLEDNSPVLDENNDDSCSEDNSSILDENDEHSENQEASRKFDYSDSLPNLGDNIDDPCPDNHDLSKENCNLSLTETATIVARVSEENLLTQENVGKELIVVDSSVPSLVNAGRCSGAKILLWTKSGTPLMDSHGFLLGEWSSIDDLSLKFTF